MAKIDDLNQQIKELSAQLRQDPLKFDTKDLEAASNYVKSLESNLREVNSELSYVRDAFADSVNELSKGNNYLNESKKALRGISSISQKLVSIKEGETKASTDQIKKLQVQAKLKFQMLQTAVRIGDLEPKDRLEIEKSILAQKEFIIGAQKVLDIQTEINKNKGVRLFGGLGDIAKAIPGLNKFSGAFQEASEAAESQARFNKLNFGNVKGIGKAQRAQRLIDLKALKGSKNLSKEAVKRLGIEGKMVTKAGLLNKTFKTSTVAKAVKPLGKAITPFMAGLKSIAPALSKALGPLSLIIEFVRAIGSADKQIVEMQKSMALTEEEAVAFRSELIGAAAATGDINFTATGLNETFGSISKQFGFIAKFSADTLITTTKLTKVVGIGAEAANNLAAAAEFQGINFEDAYKSAIGTSYELQKQEGTQFDLREILEEAGKITGTIRANLGANITAIAEAVTEAKLFGSTLNEVAAAGKQLLDFESSITNELKAELLLGRNINLERARLAALNGDQVTLAKELRREAGSYSEFMDMNVIQQEALAAAVGMQSDQLADILFKQGLQGRNVDQLKAAGEDELAKALEKQNMQDKFNNSIIKLQELFTDVFTAISPILNIVVDVFKVIGFIAKPIGALISAANSLNKYLGFTVSLITAAAIGAIAFGSAATVGVGIVAISAAIIAGVGVLASQQDSISVGDMLYDPSRGPIVSNVPGGIFEGLPGEGAAIFPSDTFEPNSDIEPKPIQFPTPPIKDIESNIVDKTESMDFKPAIAPIQSQITPLPISATLPPKPKPVDNSSQIEEKRLDREERRREMAEMREHQRKMEEMNLELISEARETNRGYLYSA